MITDKDMLHMLKGQSVIITDCEAREHGINEGCLCNLKGTVQIVDELYKTPFVGTPSWHLKGSDKRARLSEMTLIKAPNQQNQP